MQNYQLLVGKLKGKGQLVITRRIILKEQDVGIWAKFIWLRTGASGGLL
jgi:hypothetical protein